MEDSLHTETSPAPLSPAFGYICWNFMAPSYDYVVLCFTFYAVPFVKDAI